MRRGFHELWPLFKGAFGDFLEMPVKERAVGIALPSVFAVTVVVGRTCL